MLSILTILTLSILPAEENPNFEGLLNSAGENLVEKVTEQCTYSEEKIAADQKDEEEGPNYVGEMSAREVADILSEKKIHVKVKQSLEGIVEKETAQVILDQLKEGDHLESLEPATEDLTVFVKQPKVTISEPIKDTAYEQLPITIEDKQKIANILTTMAENNVFKLLFEKKRLERLGQDVNHVHPVRFLGTVFNDPRLVYCMHRIRSSSFKWGGFVDGFSERFKQELNEDNVNAFIPGLAEHLNVSASDIQGYINHRDIEGLILFLMEKSRH